MNKIRCSPNRICIISYEELADILCISLSTARDIVIRLRKKGAFKDTKHFDPKYIPEGSYSSLYVGQKAQLNEEEILEYRRRNIRIYK